MVYRPMEDRIRTQKLWNSMNRISAWPTLLMARNCCRIAPRHSISTGGTGRGQWQFRSWKTRHEGQSGWTDDSKLKQVGPLSRKHSKGRRRHGDVGAARSGLPQRRIGAAKIRAPGRML